VTRILGASVWEQEVFDHLSEHSATEASIIDEYRELASDVSSPAFAYLMNVILEDEARHHRVLGELAQSVRAFAELNSEPGAIPFLDMPRDDHERVLEATERFLDVEREDKRELEELSKILKPVRDTTLWYLLVKLMEEDTDKHIRILKFIRDRVRQTRGSFAMR
jgi:bacterioferritin (cytochrome b1)